MSAITDRLTDQNIETLARILLDMERDEQEEAERAASDGSASADLQGRATPSG